MSITDPDLKDLITRLVSELGYALVEISIAPDRNSGKKVMLYIYKKDGVGLDDCSLVASSLNLQLDALLPDLPIALNISTPGIDRQFKSVHEYTIFLGHNIEGSLKDGRTFTGKLMTCNEDGFYLNNDTNYIAYADVSKAKLKSDF